METQTAVKIEGLVEKLYRMLRLETRIEDAKVASFDAKLSSDSAVLNALGRKKRLRAIARNKISVLEAILGQLNLYGFLQSDVYYIDWCSGRGELAYSIKYVVGATVVMVDKRFSGKSAVEEIFPCTKQYGLPRVLFDLTTLKQENSIQDIAQNAVSKVAYIGLYCCGSLPDLIVRHIELQTKKPDLVAIVPCHYGEMDFEFSILASKLQIGRGLFDLLKLAAANLENVNGHQVIERKAMEVIDFCRAENLKMIGYDAKVLRLYPHEVSPFNHLIIGVRR